jgi:hypothetical protein
MARTFVERHIIPSKRERDEKIIIKFRNIGFDLNSSYLRRSVLINILIKKTKLEWFIVIIFLIFLSSTFSVYKKGKACFYIGICTPKQVKKVMENCLGSYGCGMMINK